jgi:hypothetical protein
MLITKLCRTQNIDYAKLNYIQARKRNELIAKKQPSRDSNNNNSLMASSKGMTDSNFNQEQLAFNWDLMMNKKIVSSDFKELGNIVDLEEYFFTILFKEQNQYRIPKSRAIAFNENDLLVDFPYNDLLLIELTSLNYVGSPKGV